MTNDIVQANYDQLENIAARFGNEADNSTALAQQVAQAVQTLQNGGWEGKGSAAFFAEMESMMNPAMQRLIHVFEEAQTATLKIRDIIRQAEEEASSPFGGSGAGGGNGAGSPGVVPFPGGGSPGFTPGPGQPGVPGTPGSPGGAPTISPVPQPASKDGSIWDHFRDKGDFWSYDGRKGPGGSSKGGKFNPGIKATFGTEESAVWGDPKGDGVSAIGGFVEGGVKLSLDDGVMIGGGGEFYTVKGQWDTALVGDKEYGVTAGGGFKGPSAEAFGGFQFDRKNQSVGASVGVNLVSVEGSVGGNVAGVNVSAVGELGLKAEFGITIGRKTEIKLPFVSFGIKFGGGVD